MTVFLPAEVATGASFVFDTTRSRFAEGDRLALQRIVPHLVQLRREAHAHRTQPALIDSTSAARIRLLRLTPRERVILARLAGLVGRVNIRSRCQVAVSPVALPAGARLDDSRPGL